MGRYTEAIEAIKADLIKADEHDHHVWEKFWKRTRVYHDNKAFFENFVDDWRMSRYSEWLQMMGL